MTERTSPAANSGEADRPTKQETQPAKGKPVVIPVPTREAVLRDLEKTVPKREP